MTACILFAPTLLWALEDPTRPPGASQLGSLNAADANSAWILTSTLVSDDRRLATINGRTVRQGQSIGNAQVIRIDPTGVTLLQDGERKRIALLPSSVKKDTR
jgi:hypothetical protein